MKVPFSTRCSIAKLEKSNGQDSSWTLLSHDCNLTITTDAIEASEVSIPFKSIKKAVLATSPKSPSVHLLAVDTAHGAYQFGLKGKEWASELPFRYSRAEKIDWDTELSNFNREKPLSKFTLWVIFTFLVLFSSYAAYLAITNEQALTNKAQASLSALPFMMALVANQLFVKSGSWNKRIELTLIAAGTLTAGFFMFH